MSMGCLPSQAVQVQFRHMSKSNAIKGLVRQQAERLRRFEPGNSHCEVVIDETNHRRRGTVYKVSIRYTVPGKRLFAAHAEEKSGSCEYLSSAVRLAFDEIERQLEKRRVRERRRESKALAA